MTAPALSAPSLEQIVVIAETCRLLGDPTRLRVLLACRGGPIAVNDIAAEAEASPSLVSHHLRLLKAARLVRGERRNRQIFYALADGHVGHMLADLVAHLACEAEEPEEDASHIRRAPSEDGAPPM